MIPTKRTKQLLLLKKIQNSGVFRPADFICLDLFRPEILTCDDLDNLETLEVFICICLELIDRALLDEDYEMLAQIRDANRVYTTVAEIILKQQFDPILMDCYYNTMEYYQIQLVTLTKKHKK